MTLIFDENGMLTKEILERIRGRMDGSCVARSNVQKVEKIHVDYYFVVEGFAPELLRGLVACRRMKHYDKRGKKEIKCPHCGGKFRSVDEEVRVELRCFTKHSKASGPAVPCDICNKMVGIVCAVA